MGTAGKDIFTGTAGNDTYFGGAGNDTIRGKGGNDRLFGGDDRDKIDGGKGDDRLYGGDGNDVLMGGNGDDSMFGGTGKDMFLHGNGTDHYDGGADRDAIITDLRSEKDNAFTMTVDFTKGEISTSLGTETDSFANIEGFVFLGKTKIDITMIGDNGFNAVKTGAGNDVLNGLGGRDLLAGGGGNDRIKGGQGNDKMVGGKGADRLIGGEGDDKMTGAAGNDILHGGKGEDTFRFGDTRNSGRDKILDFQDDSDTLQLKAKNLWADTLGIQDVLDDFGSFANGTATLDFGGGQVLTIQGLTALDDLLGDIIIL